MCWLWEQSKRWQHISHEQKVVVPSPKFQPVYDGKRGQNRVGKWDRNALTAKDSKVGANFVPHALRRRDLTKSIKHSQSLEMTRLSSSPMQKFSPHDAANSAVVGAHLGNEGSWIRDADGGDQDVRIDQDHFI